MHYFSQHVVLLERWAARRIARAIICLSEAWHALCGRGSMRCCESCGCFHRFGTRCE